MINKLYDKRDKLGLSVVIILHLNDNIPLLPAYCVISKQITRYARACSTYKYSIYRGKLLTDKNIENHVLSHSVRKLRTNIGPAFMLNFLRAFSFHIICFLYQR